MPGRRPRTRGDRRQIPWSAGIIAGLHTNRRRLQDRLRRPHSWCKASSSSPEQRYACRSRPGFGSPCGRGNGHLCCQRQGRRIDKPAHLFERITSTTLPHTHACVRTDAIDRQVIVEGLVPGSAAESSGNVQVGEEIVGINSVLVRDLSLGLSTRTLHSIVAFVL